MDAFHILIRPSIETPMINGNLGLYQNVVILLLCQGQMIKLG